jgi:hypothetical protein
MILPPSMMPFDQRLRPDSERRQSHGFRELQACLKREARVFSKLAKSFVSLLRNSEERGGGRIRNNGRVIY